MTGTPGSVVERRLLTPAPSRATSVLPRLTNRDRFYSAVRGSDYSNNIGAYRKVGDAASIKRQRAITGHTPVRSNRKLRPYVVDLPFGDMYIPEHGMKIVGPVNPLQRLNKIVEIPDLQGTMPSGRRFPLDRWKLVVRGENKFAAFRNVNNTFTFTHEISWIKAFNVNCKAFGPISRDRHYRFLIKLITFFGMSKKDFRCALRVRDLWVRGTRAYRKAVYGLIYSFPDEHRKLIGQLPRKPRRNN